VVACPGTRWCARALADTAGLARRIREEYSKALDPGATVCLSGCPNGCAHSGAADLGLVGGRAKRDGRRVEVWRVLAGGGMGRTPRLAEPVASGLTADEALAALESRGLV
jgi:ferredoxin-nitrite reductase